jgi:hypothetical protein
MGSARSSRGLALHGAGAKVGDWWEDEAMCLMTGVTVCLWEARSAPPRRARASAPVRSLQCEGRHANPLLGHGSLDLGRSEGVVSGSGAGDDRLLAPEEGGGGERHIHGGMPSPPMERNRPR